MFKKLKYGIIGAGHLGRYHAIQINKIESAELVGIFDILDKNSLRLSKECQTSQYLSIEELLKKCDAVSVTTPATSHFKVANIALKYGCHIFIEKPLTKTVIEAKKIIALKNKFNLKVQVGHIERFNPAFVKLTKNIQNQNLSSAIDFQHTTPGALM